MGTAYSDKLDDLRNQEPLIARARGGISAPDPFTKVESGPVATGRFMVSVSLDPRNIELLEGVDASNIGYVRCAIDAFGYTYDALERLRNAREQAARNPGWTEAQQVLIVAKEAERVRDTAARKFDVAQDTLAKGIKFLEDELSKPLATAADNGLSAEVRKYVRDLPNDKRHVFLQDALDRDDKRTLQAVLGAQSFLSGIAPEMQAHFTRALHMKEQPQLARRLDVMKKALDMIGQRGGLVYGQTEKALGAKWETVEKLRKTQSAAEAALHLVNNPVLR